MRDAFILFAKVPVPGAVKTRLVPPLTRREAAALAGALLADTAGRMARLPDARRLLFLDRPDRDGRFREEPFAGYELRVQEGRDLGERMERAMEATFAAGAERVVLAGSDIPGLAARRVAEAFRELGDGADATFGPASDGGFYLVGRRAGTPALFPPGIPWGTSAVLGEALAACRRAGLAFSLLREERDLDTPEDLLEIRRRLAAGRLPGCPRVRSLLTAGRPAPTGRW